MKSLGHMVREGHELSHASHIISFSSQVDSILGGGFPLGRIIEIAGQSSD